MSQDDSLPASTAESVGTEAAAKAAELAASEHATAGAAPLLRRLVTTCFWITMALCLAAMVSKTVMRFSVHTLWDDAYMFQRYAHNVVAHHSIAWNPDGVPTYGLTSLSFLLVAVPLYLVTGGNVSLAAILQSFICGIVLSVLLLVLVWRAAGEGRTAKVTCFTLVVFCLARSLFTDHFVSGMDTTFGLCFITLYLLASMRLVSSPSSRWAVLVGALGGLAFSVRPELTVYSFLVPLALIVLQRDRAVRRLGGIVLLVTVGVLAGHLAFAAFYFGTPLPLPFYAKSTNLYGDGFLRAYRGAPSVDLVDWTESFWPLLVIIAADVMVGFGGKGSPTPGPGARAVAGGPRAYWATSTALDKAVLPATLICVGYAFLFVVPIMGFAQRFYYPALPGLIYLACRSLGRLVGALRAEFAESAPRTTWSLAAAAAFVQVWCWLATPLSTAAKDMARAIATNKLGGFNIQRLAREQGPQKYWFGLPRIAELPDDLVVASTEVGMLSALTLGKTIVDLAGLHDPDFALRPFSAERLLTVVKPDVLYMPHPHYVQMIKDLNNHPAISEYAVYSREQLGTAQFGAAIRRSSPYFDQLERIMKKKPVALPRDDDP